MYRNDLKRYILYHTVLQIVDVYLHSHPDEHLALNFAIHILYSDTAYTAIHGDTAYRMYHPPSESTPIGL